MLLKGSCLDTLKTLPDNSIDSVVTDPPYELSFMGKSWDNTGIAYNVAVWQECLRVLKPGGHLLAFGGTRTYHRMVVAIEDAGFEIRDSIHWIYGSGFPKSLDVSKAIDKKPEALSTIGFKKWLGEQIANCGKPRKQIDDECGFTACSYAKTDGKDYWSTNHPTPEKWKTMKRVIGLSDEWDWIIPNNVAERGYVEATGGLAGGTGNTVGNFTGKQLSNKAISPEAQQWQGWGTALKPAHEPIVVARKPLIGTVANNVLTYGTGALNIDGSRVGYASGEVNFDRVQRQKHSEGAIEGAFGASALIGKEVATYKPEGRWPANVILDGSEEVLAGFPATDKGKYRVVQNDEGRLDESQYRIKPTKGTIRDFGDEGSAARFFYCAKASKSERNAGLEGLPEQMLTGRDEGQDAMQVPYKTRSKVTANIHPTVKPLALMRYLVKLVTPPGGTVLDPFLGSGTTAVAAILEGFEWIGCEMTEEYWAIIEARVAWATDKAGKNDTLF